MRRISYCDHFPIRICISAEVVPAIIIICNFGLSNNSFNPYIMQLALFLSIILSITFSTSPFRAEEVKTFTNPLFSSGADPWIIYRDGWYYYTSSAGSRIFLRKARNLGELKNSEQMVIWTPPAETQYSRDLWAPELHYIDKKWYVYFAADDGKNLNHRIYALENSSPDPTSGAWDFKGKINDPTDKWAIDASVFRYKKKLYMVWSGWEGDINGQQNIYIAEMSDPLTIKGNRVLLSKPELPWETIGDLNNPNDVPHVNVNEGPVGLIHGRDLFVVYSASGCWTDNYCLGMVRYKGSGSLLDPASWTKSQVPVFSQNPENHAYGPGHNSFFKSPDGKEDWIVYHANPKSGQGCGRFRSARAQQFHWNPDGTPDFGVPVNTDTAILLPSE
jgi:GH43 family beta-xylosidase